MSYSQIQNTQKTTDSKQVNGKINIIFILPKVILKRSINYMWTLVCIV